ncbi:MAG: hypothetical protein IT395_01270 [Candidatus Omnitrophica bacterium]|nr:hypothetical protein [Candidatus Omnitrophota bacterium]
MTSRNQKILLFIFIWALASGLGLYLRLYTLRNNVPHKAEEQATIRVIKNLRLTINQQVEKANPTLSPVEKQRIAKQQFDQILRDEKQNVRDAIAQASLQLTNNIPHEENPVYLLASDSYYYYNLTQNIVDTGKISEKTQGSKYFNALMNAPQGYWEPLRLYPYVGFAVYKIVSLFQGGILLMEGVSYTPLFLTVFIILVFLLGCYILECSPATSFLGAIYLLCAPIFLRRSMFGWYDDDPPNIFFLFAILTVFFYGLKDIAHRRTLILSALGCSILFTLYALFWQGWVFLACIIAASAFAIIIYNHFIRGKRSETPKLLLYSSLTMAGIFLGVGLVFGPQDFFTLFKEGWAALQDFIDPQLSLWPDLYIAVGELLPPTSSQWIQMMGGLVFIIIAVIGLLARGIDLFIKRDDKTSFSTIVLLIFAAIGVKLSFGAQRFETLCLIPFAFAFPVGLNFLWTNFRKFVLSFIPLIKQSPLGQNIILVVLVAALAGIQFQSAQKITPEILNKIFNSTWDAALTKIKKGTPQDSIINTWWPPGHFIKAVAQRRVTFDGATINKPQSYWIANALLATDERAAAGILRMLNSSGNDATDYLIKENFPLSQAVDLIKSIVALDEPQAREVLAQKLTPKQIDELIRRTHGQPPPSYLLIYNDMAQDSLQFSFVGNWDFRKIEAINKDEALQKKVPQHGSKEYVPFLWKMAGGPPRYTDLLVPVAEKGRAIIFENNILIDRDAMTSTVNSVRYGRGVPRHLFYDQGDEFIEKDLPNATLPISVMLINDKTGPKCMLAETSLARSVLMRFYYFGGKGLKIFEPFTEEEDETRRTRIVIYKINWDKL